MNLKITLTIVLLGLLTTCFGQQKLTWGKWSWLVGEWAGE